MKTDIQTANEAVTPNSRELNILKKYFPQCFSKPDTDENGNIIKEHFDIEKLAEILNKDEVDIKKEGFTLNFLGKSYAHYQSNLDSETVIVYNDPQFLEGRQPPGRQQHLCERWQSKWLY